MSNNGTEAYVASIPDCDIHKYHDKQSVPAVYDARTLDGRWAYLCEEHFLTQTTRDLGVGHGQRLVLKANG